VNSRLLLSAVLLLSLCMPVAAQGLPGRFEISTGDAASHLELRLECDSESSCLFVSVTRQGNASPTHDLHMLGEVRVSDTSQAAAALSHALAQRGRPIRDAAFARLMERLAPVLAASPVVDKCWDLNYTAADFLLACTLSTSAGNTDSIYLFASSPVSCSEAFCRYVIYPMTRVKESR
jgi:hypothetical protein